MRFLLGLCILLLAPLSHAQLPEGRWVNTQLTQDDGDFGKYYQGWLFTSPEGIDQIITLGMHYAKTKFRILSDDGSTLRVFDHYENLERDLNYTLSGNSLKVCTENNSCITYQRTNEKPVTEPAPAIYPIIHIETRFCIEADCESLEFKGIPSEMLYNLNEGFTPAVWTYAAPDSLFARHGIRLSVVSYSYRFSNDSVDLASFMTSLALKAENDSDAAFIDRSGSLTLKEGPLSRLEGSFQGRQISLDFSIHKAN